MQTRTNNTICFSQIDGLFHNRAGESKYIYFLQYLSTILIGISKKDVKKLRQKSNKTMAQFLCIDNHFQWSGFCTRSNLSFSPVHSGLKTLISKHKYPFPKIFYYTYYG